MSSGSYLGLDLGTKRVGIAWAPSDSPIASALQTIEYSSIDELASQLNEIIQKKKVELIIVGMPKNLKGQESHAAENIRKLLGSLQEKIECEWKWLDERLTTREVERVLINADMSRKKRKTVIDGLAAQRILQMYLDQKGFGS